MKNNIRIAALIALGLVSVSAAQASTTDLLLGFNDAAGPSAANNDYVIDLGLNGNTLISDALGNGGTWNLSSQFTASTFSTAFSADGSAGNNVAAGVVGGISGSPNYLFSTFAGIPSAPTKNQFQNSLSDAQSPSIGEYSSATAGGWSSLVAASPTSGGTIITGNAVAQNTGNPTESLSSGSLSIDLWENTRTGLNGQPTGWVDEGTFTINTTSDSVIFSTPSAVPEPATYGLLSGAGLLVLGLRRQLSLKKA